jgi:hypothetical protein
MVGTVESDSTLIERWVRRLTPPACREEVLGDLAERCGSPHEYLREALRTLPLVIASRLRRSTKPLYLLMMGMFFWWAIFYGNYQAHWQAATIPTVLILAVLALRDAWRAQTLQRLARTVAIDTALVAAAVLLSQAMLWFAAPALVLNRAALIIGLPLGLVILYFLRLQSPTGIWLAPGFARQLSLGQIRGEIAAREGVYRRAVAIEMGACVVVVAVFAAFLLWAPAPTIGRIGFGLTVLGALFVGAFLWRYGRVRPIPADLDFGATVQRYRNQLEQHRRLCRSYLWWYIVPLAIGINVTMVGFRLQRAGGARGAAVDVVVVSAILALPTLLQGVVAAKTQKRIEQLALLSEKREGE